MYVCARVGVPYYSAYASLSVHYVYDPARVCRIIYIITPTHFSVIYIFFCVCVSHVTQGGRSIQQLQLYLPRIRLQECRLRASGAESETSRPKSGNDYYNFQDKKQNQTASQKHHRRHHHHHHLLLHHHYPPQHHRHRQPHHQQHQHVPAFPFKPRCANTGAAERCKKNCAQTCMDCLEDHG